MIEMRMGVPSDAPDEIKQFVKDLKDIVVPTPPKEELAAMLALEPGAEQDKLYNESFKRQFAKALRMLLDQVNALQVASHSKGSN